MARDETAEKSSGFNEHIMQTFFYHYKNAFRQESCIWPRPYEWFVHHHLLLIFLAVENEWISTDVSLPSVVWC